MKKLREASIIILPALVVLIMVFSIWGYFSSPDNSGWSLWAILFSSIQTIMMSGDTPVNVHWMLNVARFLGVVFIGFSVILLILNYARNGVNRISIQLRYRRHNIIFGLGSKGFLLAKELLNDKEKVIVIEVNEHNEHIPEIEELNGIVLTGDAMDKKILKWLKLRKARRVIFVLDSDDKNIETANLIANTYTTKKWTHELSGLIHIEDEDNLLILKDFLGVYQNLNNLEINEFNINDAAAAHIYDTYPPHSFIEKTLLGERTNIAIIGSNKVAEAFIVENIILSHYEDLVNIKIWLFHQYAGTIVNTLTYKYPFLKDYIDLIPVSMKDSRFSEFHLPDGTPLPSEGFNVSYVFEDKDAQTINTAKRFRQFLYTRYNDLKDKPIIACIPDQARITDLINLRFEEQGTGLNFDTNLEDKLNIRIIRIFHDTLTKANLIDRSELNEKLARVINYFYSLLWEFQFMDGVFDKLKAIDANREPVEILQEVFLSIPLDTGEPLIGLENRLKEVLSEYNRAEAWKFTINNRWKTLTAIKKNSNRYAARHLEVKLRAISPTMDIPAEITKEISSKLAPMEHKRWCAEELVLNFRKGKFTKESKKILKNELKIHDLIVPFEELDEANVLKDEGLFLLIPQLIQICDYYKPPVVESDKASQ